MHDQKASKLSSLASLQLTPTLLDRRNNLQNKSTYQLTKSAKNININDPYETLLSNQHKHLHHNYPYPTSTSTILDDLMTNENENEENRVLEKSSKLESDLINGKLVKQSKLKQKCNIDAISYDSLINSTKLKSKRPLETVNDTLISSSASSNTINTATFNVPTALVNNTAVLNRKLEASMTSLDSCASTIIGN